jgi:hypothetical protein
VSNGRKGFEVSGLRGISGPWERENRVEAARSPPSTVGEARTWGVKELSREAEASVAAQRFCQASNSSKAGSGSPSQLLREGVPPALLGLALKLATS